MNVARVGVGIILLKNNKVLLGKRNSDPKKASSELHGEGTWTLPGGKINFGEKIINCTKRETLEETGIKIKGTRLVSVTDEIVYDAHFVSLVFLCDDFENEPKIMEPEKITEWKWFPIERLPEPMYIPSKNAINNFKEGKIYKGD